MRDKSSWISNSCVQNKLEFEFFSGKCFSNKSHKHFDIAISFLNNGFRSGENEWFDLIYLHVEPFESGFNGRYSFWSGNVELCHLIVK